MASEARKLNVWEPEEDENFLLDFINEVELGANQSQAFKVAAYKNGKRTYAACAFRWNNTLSKIEDNKEMYHKAREIGKNKTYVPPQLDDVTSEVIVPEVNDVDVQSQYNDDVAQAKEFVDSVATVFERNRELEQLLAAANRKIETLEKENSVLKADVQAFSNIFNKAREIAVSEEISAEYGRNNFKMDRNGNLERV